MMSDRSLTVEYIDGEEPDSFANRLQRKVLTDQGFSVSDPDDYTIDQDISLSYRDIYGSDINIEMDEDQGFFDFVITETGDIDLCGIVDGKPFESLFDLVIQNCLLKLLADNVAITDLNSIVQSILSTSPFDGDISRDQRLDILRVHIIRSLMDIGYVTFVNVLITDDRTNSALIIRIEITIITGENTAISVGVQI